MARSVPRKSTKKKAVPRKSTKKAVPRKSTKKAVPRKRVLGTGACTSRKISECTKDTRCQIRRRPKGGRTCVLGRGWKQVHDELAMIEGH